MDTCLAFAITGSNRLYKVDGSHLISLLHAEMEKVLNRVTPKAASESDPVALSSYEDWLQSFSWLRNSYMDGKKKTIRYKIGGRTIEKLKEGPVDASNRSDGFYMRDAALGGNGSAAEELRKVSGPSYQDFGSYYWRITSQAMDEGGYAALTSTAATCIRDVLRGSSVDYSAFTDGTALAYPLLAAVMFLAEPGRNPRAFAIAHMVLDLLGEPYHFDYGSKGAFTSSMRAGVSVPQIPGQADATMRGRLTLDVALANESRIGAASGSGDYLKEGEFSPTPKGSAAAGVNSVLGFPDVGKVKSALQTAPVGSGRTAKVDFSNVPNVLQKEQNILVNWVTSRLAKERRAENLGIVPFALNDSVDKDVCDATAQNGVPPLLLERLYAQVEALIAIRVGSPNAM